MGLDTTHGCWNGPYSSFNTWRVAICEAAGVPFNREGYTAENLLGIWDTDPDDILDVLIEHQDCEGRIMNKHCGPLAERLIGLLPTIISSDTYHDLPHSITHQTQQFIAGLLFAEKAGEDVEFH